MNPFIRPRPVDEPGVRLIGFHHAGGSAAVYHPMVRVLPANWDLLLLDLPGRGKRYGQAPLEHTSEIVALAAEDARPWLDAPVAIFGHSLGAIVGVEVARVLRDTATSPVWVGVSGRVPPSFQPVDGPRLHELSDTALMDELLAMGGMPERIAEIPEFRERFLRVVRVDLRAADTYRPAIDRAPLHCPLTVFGGSDDAWAPLTVLSAWAEETTNTCRLHVFPGGHFYFLGPAFTALTHRMVADIQGVISVTTPRHNHSYVSARTPSVSYHL